MSVRGTNTGWSGFSTLFKRDKLAKIYGGASDQNETYRVDFESCSSHVERAVNYYLIEFWRRIYGIASSGNWKSLSIVDPIKASTTVASSQKGKLDNHATAASQKSVRSGDKFSCMTIKRLHKLKPLIRSYFTNYFSYKFAYLSSLMWRTLPVVSKCIFSKPWNRNVHYS